MTCSSHHEARSAHDPVASTPEGCMAPRMGEAERNLSRYSNRQSIETIRNA